MSGLNAMEFAGNWYQPDDIHRSINSPPGESGCLIPHDVHSREFAEWLCVQYRLAMAKGIDIGRSRVLEATQRQIDGLVAEVLGDD